MAGHLLWEQGIASSILAIQTMRPMVAAFRAQAGAKVAHHPLRGASVQSGAPISWQPFGALRSWKGAWLLLYVVSFLALCCIGWLLAEWLKR